MADIEVYRDQTSTQILEDLILSYCVMKQHCLEKLPLANSQDVADKLKITINNCEAMIGTLKQILFLFTETNK